MSLFSFFIKKKETDIPDTLKNILAADEYLKFQDSLIAFFEKNSKAKIEKIRKGIVYLKNPMPETQEDRFDIADFLGISQHARDYTIEQYWEDYLLGFDYKKLNKWENAEKYLGFANIPTPLIQKKAVLYQWISETEHQAYILRLPNRSVQVSEQWLASWKKTTEELKKHIFEKQSVFLFPKKDTDQRIGSHTKRPRRSIGDSTDFDLKITINQNLVDRKLGVINDACPLPDNVENYENKIRFTGGEAH